MPHTSTITIGKWKDINFPTKQKDYNKFEHNNPDVALNILQTHSNKNKLYVTRKSNYNRKRKHQVISLMTSDNGNNHHCLPVKRLSRLCRGITSNNNSDHYCLNCLQVYGAENRLKKHKIICNNNDHYTPIMSEKGKNILTYKHDKKSLSVPHIIYGHLECLLRTIQSCQPNPNGEYTVQKKSAYTIWIRVIFTKVLRPTHNNSLQTYRLFAKIC